MILSGVVIVMHQSVRIYEDKFGTHISTQDILKFTELMVYYLSDLGFGASEPAYEVSSDKALRAAAASAVIFRFTFVTASTYFPSCMFRVLGWRFMFWYIRTRSIGIGAWAPGGQHRGYRLGSLPTQVVGTSAS